MSDTKEFPLTAEDLDSTAGLCLAYAATTDLDDTPFSIGRNVWRRHHACQERFEKATAKMRKGVTSISELGLLPNDCSWVATHYATGTGAKSLCKRFWKTEELISSRG